MQASLECDFAPIFVAHNSDQVAVHLLGVCRNLRRLNVNVPQEEVDHGPPWQIPPVSVSYTPTCRRDPPCQQKQLALETIAKVMSSIPASHTIYVDGSLQTDGSAACALFPYHGTTKWRMDWTASAGLVKLNLL